MKKVSSVILSLSLALGMLPAAALAKPSALPLPTNGNGKITQPSLPSDSNVLPAPEQAAGQEPSVQTAKPSDGSDGRPSILPSGASSAQERVIVIFKSKADKSLVEQAKGRVNQEFRNIPALAISVPAAAIQGLKNNPNIESIEIDQPVQTEQTQDWGISKTKAPSAWTSGYTGKGVKVAVIDTGIASHEDLAIAGGASVVGYASSYSLKQVVDKAYSQGILVVAAAGNNGTADGSGDTVNYPARYDSAIAVAATDSSDRRGSFSATGSTVEVAAPGVDVLSTYLGNQYAKMSGTSMAAPFVAGDLALLKQAYPSLTAVELRAKLASGVIDLGAAGRDPWFGYGLVQAPQATVSQPAPAPTPASSPVLLTKTSVMTSKASYRSGETVAISVKVSDASGAALQGAAVSLTVADPKGAIASAQAVTSSSGAVSFNLPTGKSSIKGTYSVKAAVSLSNYAGSSASTSFQLK